MKPRNQRQRHILALSKKLPPISNKQRQWAIEHCFHPDAYHTKGTVWCLHCGNIFPKDIYDNHGTCPKCGRVLTEVENSRKAKYKERWYYTIITTIGGYQVLRHFIVSKAMCKVSKYIHSCQQPLYCVEEAVQHWLDEEGHETIIARPRIAMCNSMCYDVWDFHKPMAIRAKNQGSTYYGPNAYDIDAMYIYPYRSILPKARQRGYTSKFEGFSHSELLRMLLSDDKMAETLIKNKQYTMLAYRHNHGACGLFSRFEHAIRIADRNRYIVKDTSMWFDYLHLLEYFHLDTHNAHYVCPKDLKAEHDKLMRRKQRIEQQLERERKIADAKRWEDEYRASKSKFFGICFGNDNIIITVIPSVAEIAEEGKAMHHCVYTNGYYKKEDSLILSARDRDGNRIETIELSLKTFQVVQSRGVNNSNTVHHDEIIKLVQDNVKLIMKAA